MDFRTCRTAQAMAFVTNYFPQNLLLGRAAGQQFNQAGGTCSVLCLAMNPKFGTYSDSADTNQYIYGAEYRIDGVNPFNKNINLHDVPCATCRVETRGSKLILPGRNKCPNGWTLEYDGYLMSAHYGHTGRTQAVCVDKDADGVPGSISDDGGSSMLWYTIQASCGSLPCGPYVQGREITCAVCTK